MRDQEMMFARSQSLVGAAGAFLSDKSIAIGAPQQSMGAAFQAVGNMFGRDLGKGEPLHAFVEIAEDFDSAGDAVTLVAALIMADNAALTSNPVTLLQSRTYEQAELVAGTRIPLGAVPVGTTKAFVGVLFTTAVADATAGRVTSGLETSIRRAA